MLEIPSGRRQQVERRQGLLKREASKLYLQEQQQQVLDHYLDQKGLLQYLYCSAYQFLIIAAALPPIAARCAKPGTQLRFETKIILYT